MLPPVHLPFPRLATQHQNQHPDEKRTSEIPHPTVAAKVRGLVDSFFLRSTRDGMEAILKRIAGFLMGAGFVLDANKHGQTRG